MLLRRVGLLQRTFHKRLFMICLPGVTVACLLAAAGADAAPARRGPARVDAQLERVLATTTPSDRVIAWVHLTDKGPAATAAGPAVTPRSLARRAKVMMTPGLEWGDRPLCEPYVDRIARRVARIRQRSRWFNAVSIEATPAQIASVRQLPEVREVALVARFRRPPGSEGEMPQLEPGPAPTPALPKPSRDLKRPGSGTLEYGDSRLQNELLHVPELHDRGLTGKGVLIGHFDTGYRLLSHQSLAMLHVTAGRDFVDHDNDPAPPVGTNFGSHGVSTLSVLAGFAPGQLIGPAYGADFALARTENEASETPVEEDNWVAAIEWADSLGCDIVSSSLGYLEYDAGFPSWTWRDMDGNTTLITRAADLAVARGIVVVAGAGNGGQPTQGRGNTLNAPADGDSVFAIGGVWIPPGTTDPVRYSTSSMGPSFDGRTKPDFVALGAPVYLAGTGNPMHYGFNSGTSFSCPAVAGVIALILEAVPATTPMQIRDALRVSASRAYMPDNEVGWGVVDGVRALAALETPVVPRSLSDVKQMYRGRRR